MWFAWVPKFFRWFARFFEGEGGTPSMTRLLLFISIWPSSYVVVAEKSADIFGWYIGGYVLGYVGGKGTELLNRRPVSQPAPVNINQPEKVNVGS